MLLIFVLYTFSVAVCCSSASSARVKAICNIAMSVCERRTAAFERIVTADARTCAPGGRLATAVDAPSLRRGVAWHCRRRTLASRFTSWVLVVSDGQILFRPAMSSAANLSAQQKAIMHAVVDKSENVFITGT